MSECESAQKLTISTLDHLKRTLDRLKAKINVIEKDQQYLVDEFNDMEKKKEGLSFKQEVDKRTRDH